MPDRGRDIQAAPGYPTSPHFAGTPQKMSLDFLGRVSLSTKRVVKKKSEKAQKGCLLLLSKLIKGALAAFICFCISTSTSFAVDHIQHNHFSSSSSSSFASKMTHQDLYNDTGLEKVEVAHSEDAVDIQEHQVSTWECARKNPKAILWALYANCMSPHHTNLEKI